LPIQLSGVTINSGDFVIADEDGVVSVAPSLLIEILEKLQHIQRKDQAKMDLINSGGTLPPDLDALLDRVGIDWQDH
jgi:regulator of RNase E activity RraA